jgi:hypothetical protein
MQIVWVAIWLPVQESYGFGVKTVEKPFVLDFGTPELLAMLSLKEQSMTGVAGVFDNF